MSNFCLEHELYEVLTQEYITALAAYLEGRIRLLQERTGQPVTILEVGAGDGRLTHFLEQKLTERNVTGFRMIATDGGQWRIKPLYPVTSENVDTALWDYEPQIVLSCWMPKLTDWTADIRKAPSVEEYILIGPADSGTCGDNEETWGHSPVRSEVPAYIRDGFRRVDHEELSALQLGQKDRPGSSYSTTVSFQREHPSEA